MKPIRTVDITRLIGTPYERMDCFDLVKKFFKLASDTEIFDAIPSAEGNWERSVLIQANKGKFKKVESPRYGDIVVIRVHGLECHLGVVVEGGRFLHTTIKTGAILDQIGRWNKMIAGYYRLEDEASGYQD